MAWGPFRSKGEIEAERRVRLHQGKVAIKDYLTHVQRASSRYREMAKKALSLGEKGQANQYVAMILQYENQYKRWQKFQLKLADIELRGTALKAMGDLVGGLDGLVKSINRGLSLPEMDKTMVELQAGMMKVDQVESHMSSHMDNLSINVGPDSLSTNENEVPEELKGEVERICKTLMEEVAVESRSPMSSTVAIAPSQDVDIQSTLGERVAQQIDRMTKLRAEGGKK